MDYDSILNYKDKKYYHGTSDIFNINIILPPIETGIIREDFRKNNKNVVYITSSLGSAQKYAQKAAILFGGKPIVYEVEPDWDSLVRRIDFEYITYSAKILRVV